MKTLLPLIAATLLAAIITPAAAQNRNVVPLFNLPLGGGTMEVCAAGDYAYVARGAAGIEVVKIAGIGSPARMGTIRPYLGSANIDIQEVEISGNILYASNAVPNGSPTPHTGLFMFDLAANPMNPPPAGDITWGVFPLSYKGGSARGFCVNVNAGQTYAYIASAITNSVEVFDVTSPAAPVYKAGLRPLANSSGFVAGSVHDVAVKNGKCVSTWFEGGFSVHDVSNIAASGLNPQMTALINTTSLLNTTKYANANTFHASFSADGNTLLTTDGKAYIGCRSWNLANITTPATPLVHTAQYTSGTGSKMHNITVSGKYVYISHFLDGLRVLELLPTGAFRDVAFYDTVPASAGLSEAGAWGVFVDGERVLLSDTLTGLHSLDFRDTIAVTLADWKQSTGTLTVEGTSTAAPSVGLSVYGVGSMTWNVSTGKYRLVQTGVTTNPLTISVVSDIGGVQTATVRRR